jgi:hypothetical protein
MNFCYEWTGCIDIIDTAIAEFVEKGFRHAVGADYNLCVLREGIEVFDNRYAMLRQVVDNVCIMYYWTICAGWDGGGVCDVNGALYAEAKSGGFRKVELDFHWILHPSCGDMAGIVFYFVESV